MDTYIVLASDSLSNKIQSAIMGGNATELAILNQHAHHGEVAVKTWVEGVLGKTLLYGGVTLVAIVPDSAMAGLNRIHNQISQLWNTSVSVGVGLSLQEADKAMQAAQARGGGRILFYTPDLDQPKAPEPQQNDDLKPLIQNVAKSEEADPQSKFVEADGANEPKKDEPAFGDGASQAGDPEGVKATVVKILQKIKSQKETLDQLRQVAPETYQALMGAIQAMIVMARSMVDPSNPKDEEGDDAAPNANDQAKAQSGLQEQAVSQEREMALGMQHEMKEHGISQAEALKLATDHLKQDPTYYTKRQGA